MQLFSHAFAKAAMFMAAGLIAETLGHDRIAEFGGVARILPVTTFAFGIAGLSLMGVPPSGGFVAKWLLLQATVMEGQWWWAAVMLVGDLLAGGYILTVLGKALSSADAPPKARASVTRSREVVALSPVCSLAQSRAVAAVGISADWSSRNVGTRAAVKSVRCLTTRSNSSGEPEL
jgi:multicomponent Na+:H+ antiporter subunit D